MTPEEITKLIEENKLVLEASRADQRREREIRTFVLDEPEDVPDDVLETRRYEPRDAAQATEIE